MDNARIKSKSLFIEALLRPDGRKLVEIAEQALAVRDYATLTRIGVLLCDIPGGRNAGLLYTALALNRTSGPAVGDALFQELAESPVREIRARALLAAGSNLREKGDTVGAMQLYSKASQLDTCPLFLRCHAMMCIISKSTEGHHGEALEALNSINKLARYVGRVYPSLGFDYLNSVAVELNATGYKDEARKIIGPVVASPYVSKYTEWTETAAEINQPLKVMTNVLPFPVSRPEQVRRMFAIATDKSLDGPTLKRGVDVLHKEVYRV